MDTYTTETINIIIRLIIVGALAAKLCGYIRVKTGEETIEEQPKFIQRFIRTIRKP